MAAILRQRASVGGEDRALERELVALQADPQGRILGDLHPPSDRFGELSRGTGTRALPRLSLDVRRDLLLLCRFVERDQLVGGDEVVPDLERRRASVLGDALTVRAQTVRNRLFGDALRQPVLAGEDDDAGDEP